MEDPEWGLLLWLTMITGLRRGELSALRWKHVDFERACLVVQRSNAQPRSGLKEKETKTRQRRRLALDAQTIDLLLAHRQRASARSEALGCRLGPDCWLFSPAADSSAPFTPRIISLRYRRLAKSLNLSSTRFHALRHYSATELIAAGVDVRTVAGRLGHGSGGATTLRIYAGWVDEAGRRAADMIANLMPRPVTSERLPRGPYEAIANALRQQIESQDLRHGDRLPTVAELATLHRVSVGTAHRAIALLAGEGLVNVTRGQRATVA